MRFDLVTLACGLVLAGILIAAALATRPKRPVPPSTVCDHPSSHIIPRQGPYDWSKNDDLERHVANWSEEQR